MRRVAAEHSVAPDEAAQRSYASRSSLLAASQVSAGVRGTSQSDLLFTIRTLSGS